MHSKAELLTQVTQCIFKANGQLLDWGDHFSQPHAITSARWQVLYTIENAAVPLSAPKLSETIGVSRQAIQKQINLLIKDGLIHSVTNPRHKRSVLYVLCDEGRVRYDALMSQWWKHAHETSKKFSTEELETTLAVIKKIIDTHSPTQPNTHC